MAVIDIHAHIISPELISTLRRGGPTYGIELEDLADGGVVARMAGGSSSKPFPPELGQLDVRLAAMDQQGVDVQVLSSWADLTGYRLPPAEGAAFSRLQNETIAEIVQSHPDRYLGSATVPLQDPRMAVQVLEDALNRLDFRAVQIGTFVGDRFLDDPSFEPFWDATEALGTLVLVHPYEDNPLPALRAYFLFNALGNPLQTTMALARLMFGGVIERHPRLKVSFAHGGGLLPFQIGRLRKVFASRPEPHSRGATLDPLEVLKRCYFDTVLNEPRTMDYLAGLVGPERLLMGSDFPFESGDADPVNRVRASALSASDQAQVLGGTAAQLLGLTR
ncbi:MAG: amidohydrolase family protein [Chloroflexi bacterium]|nr:amidohydrolase family protein [Chloroflexota bacterium]